MNPIVAQAAEQIIEKTFIGLSKKEQGYVIVGASIVLCFYGIYLIKN
jgi:hypothetical protein